MYLGGTMETIIEMNKQGRYNKIYVERDTLNSISLKNNFLIHKQIERRNGFTYMRVKKRDLATLS
jgi:hypothetical protein